MGWNGVVSPNLSELVRAVRTVDELPIVRPKLSYQITSGDDHKDSSPAQEIFKSQIAYNVSGNRYANPPIGSFGGDKPHNNLQTSRAAYIWLRTA